MKSSPRRTQRDASRPRLRRRSSVSPRWARLPSSRLAAADNTAGARRRRPTAHRSMRHRPRCSSPLPTRSAPTNTVDVACNGTPIARRLDRRLVSTAVSLTVAVPNPLPKGECAVSWVVSQPDGRPRQLDVLVHRGQRPRCRASCLPGTTPVASVRLPAAARPSRRHRWRRRPRTSAGIGLRRAARSVPAADLAGRRRAVRRAGADRHRLAGGRRVHPHRALLALGVAAHVGVRDLQRRVRARPDLRRGHRRLAVADVVGRPHRHHTGHRRAGQGDLRRRSPGGW